MSVPSLYYLKLTDAGKAAAINPGANSIATFLTHLSFGTAQYDPNGQEVALFNEVKRVPLGGATRPRPNQLRVAGAWVDSLAESEIGEIGLWAGDVLFAVWSRSAGGPIGFKTQAVDFVAFCEIVFDEIPASAVEVVINPDVGEALSAILVHQMAGDAHPQYLPRRDFVTAHSLMLAETVAGSGDAINLTMPADTVLQAYGLGQRVAFVAAAPNTGPVVADVNGLGPIPVRKAGALSLAAGDIVAGCVYTLMCDGGAWQITSGVGASASIALYTFTATAGQTDFAAPYLPGGLIVTHNGRVLVGSNFVDIESGDPEYEATNGETVVLDTPCAAGDVVNLLAFNSLAVANAWTKAESDARYVRKVDIEVKQAGEVSFFAASVPPPGWLRANGAAVSRTTYAALFAAIGTRFGAGDGATTFRLPDLRGEFIRGWDDGRGVDAGRQLGSAQGDEVRAHQHETVEGAKYGYANQSSWAGRWLIDPSAQNMASIKTGRTGGTETRPRNIAMLGCIRY